MNRHFKYIYGPVFSWRLGRSWGIDPLSQHRKVCNFDCIYCQLGKTAVLTREREIFVPTEEIIAEIKSLPDIESDCFTFSGRGEPTLARNLGDIIASIRSFRPEKIAVITNSSLLHREDVRRDLISADVVVAKLDACSPESFALVDQPIKELDFSRVVQGLLAFRKEFHGKLALQIMFMKENRHYANALARLAGEISADEVELNTPTRACAVEMLSPEEMEKIKIAFRFLPVKCVFDHESHTIQPLDRHATKLRHGRLRYSSAPRLLTINA